MENKLEKPSDILTVKEAIDLINSDTPENRIINNGKLIRNVEFLRSNFRGGGMNYTIFMIKKLANGKIVPNGVKFVAVTNRRDQTDLEYAITDHYKAMSGKDIDPDELGLMQVTTAVDESAGNLDGMARKNTTGKRLKKGDRLRTGTETVTSEAN